MPLLQRRSGSILDLSCQCLGEESPPPIEIKFAVNPAAWYGLFSLATHYWMDLDGYSRMFALRIATKCWRQPTQLSGGTSKLQMLQPISLQVAISTWPWGTDSAWVFPNFDHDRLGRIAARVLLLICGTFLVILNLGAANGLHQCRPCWWNVSDFQLWLCGCFRFSHAVKIKGSCLSISFHQFIGFP